MKEEKKRKKWVEKDNNLGRFFELATTNKIFVNSVKLHEISFGILKVYTGDFGMIGSMLIGETEQKANIGLKKLMILNLILMLSVMITTLKTSFLKDGCKN